MTVPHSNILATMALGTATIMVGGVALLAGCSAASGPSTPPTITGVGKTSSGHAIHVFAKHSDGTSTQLNFGPATEVSFGGHASTPQVQPQPADTPGFSDDGGLIETPPTVQSPGTDPDSTAWVLVSRAAQQCGYTNQTIPPWQTVADIYPWFIYWNGRVTVTQNCAERLQFEQNLVCVADKLGEIADAVGTVVWPAVLVQSPPLPTQTYGTDAGVDLADWDAEWDIPPQADSDRFIVRDLAIHTLAMIPTVDAFTDIVFPTSMFPSGSRETCGQAFAWLANPTNTQGAPGGCIDESIGIPVFGFNITPNTIPEFPPSAAPFCDGQGTNNTAAIAQTAVDLDAQIVRAGGRLLHDLVRRDVYSDMAAAAQQSAQALDPVLGNEYAWGAADAGLYGTVAHAARVLVGRWEIGDQADFGNVADPQCEGTTELNLVPSAFGSELSARVLDRPIRTAGEQTAVQLVERSGIVLPSCSIPTSGSAQSLRTALQNQLLLQEQLQNNLPAPPPATALSAVIGPLADDEVIFAFQRALRTWRLLTDAADTTADGGTCSPVAAADSTGALLAGLVSATAHASVSSLQGVVVQGGLSRSRLATDPMARAGGMSEASQCSDSTGYWNEWGVDETATMMPSGAATGPITQPPMAALPPGVFQDAFHIGQAMERRLNVIQSATQNLTFQDPANQAKGGIAELRSWAGSTIVHAWVATAPGVGSSVAGTGTVLSVRVAGMNYQSDFYLAQQATYSAVALAPVQTAFGFVYGPPWVAECAAGLRANCPANFTATYVQTATAITDVTSSFAPTGANGAAGVLDNVFELTVPITGATASKFTPPMLGIGTGSAQESHVYMVRLHDPASQSGQGRVLGTLPLRASYVRPPPRGNPAPVLRTDIVGFVDAPMQRELVHDAIDLGKWVGAAPPAIGDPSAAQTSGYCVDGVPRDLFVPLDNELISGTQTYEDSWQAYLALAQQAAQTADTLGQQLIANDLLISENQQAAEEQLANICGDFGALSTATVSTDGTVTAGAEDPTTQQCLTEQTTDVVFLGQLPAPVQAAVQSGASPAALTAAVKAAINCAPTPPATTPPSASQLCQKPTLTVGALGVTASAPSGKVVSGPASLLPSAACTSLVQGKSGSAPVASTLRGGFQGTAYLNLLNDPSLSPSALQLVADQMNMTVDLDGNWRVFYGSNAKIMDSSDVNYWPDCIDTGCQNLTPLEAVMVPAWDNAFRDCQSGTQTQVLGCGAPAQRAAELNLIRLRVAKAMWTVAMSAGTLPSGMFTQPMPAVFTDFCDGNNCIAYYPTGVFTYYQGTPTPAPPATCSYGATSCYELSTANDGDVTSQDIAALGSIFDVPPSFQSFMSDSAQEVPYWYRQAYSSAYAGSVKHVVASNSAAFFSSCIGNMVNTGTGCGSPQNAYPGPPSSPQSTSLYTLLANANNLDGFACTATYGEPVSGPTPQDPRTPYPWWTEVAVADLSYSMTVPCTQPGYWGANSQLSGAGNFTVGYTWNSMSDYWWGGGYYIPVQWNSFSTGVTDVPTVLLANGWDLSSAGSYNGQQVDFGLDLNHRVPNPPAWPFAYSGGTVPGRCWGENDRALLFAGANAVPNGTCGAMSLVLGASVLACTPTPAEQTISSLSLSQVPPVNSLADIPTLIAWLSLAQGALASTVGGLYIQTIPTRVVSDFRANTVGSGSLGGTQGQAVLGIEQSIQAFPSAWVQIATDLQSIASAIQIAQLSANAASLSEQTADGALALNTIQVQGAMAQALGQFIQTVGQAAGNVVGDIDGATLVVTAGATMSLIAAEATGQAELGQLQSMANTASQTEQNQVAQAMAQLNATTGPLWADVQKQIDALRADVAQIDASGQTVVQTQNEAAYQAAIGTGQDFVVIAGQEVPIPVDTVLRRQASATEKRYQSALTNAKALAYMARRAIEQRIGVTLDQLTQQVGPLDAPASWADDICSLQGVNYAALSTAVPATDADGGADDGGGMGGSADNAAISQFADAWVGDYVAKLQNFVTYFNTQYPSHQGDDTAILSLRYDLLPPMAQCSTQAPNLLLNSGDMTQFTSPGWQLSPCEETSGKCLAVIGGYALGSPQDGPAGAQAAEQGGAATDPALAVSGISWLSDVQVSAGDAGASLEAGAGDASTPNSSWPKNLLVQQVQLAAGSYVLSWWDQARDANGNVLWSGGASPVPYLVEVFDPSWGTIVSFEQPPYTPPEVGEGGAPLLWSARHVLSFTVSTGGTYAVAFAPSTLGEGPGNVAIADVQIEQAASGQPSTYVATGSSTMVAALDCPLSDADLRAAFVHTCDNTGVCWYDLAAPFIVDTTQLGGGSALGTKLANGNYNYRHINSAINLVGTNVHNCANDPSPNCYGSAYEQYDLQHDATNAGIIGYDGNARIFDFGIASINHGKALAAERYITMPISSNDQQLITQPGIEHIEFGGRPLDGTYHLRIWDSPDLNWPALQDIQIILDYEYWSQIQANGNVSASKLHRRPIKPIIKSLLNRR